MASIVKSLRLLADPTRLRLLLLLQQAELSVAELQEILGMGQSRISTHLAQLKTEHLVNDRRAGKNIYYNLTTPLSPHFAEILKVSASELAERSSDQRALELVMRKRQDKAREYFNKLAGKFGRSYCPGRTWEAVAHMLLTLIGPITVADLGAGEGTLSQLIARRAKKVIAIDNSENMVQFGTDLAKTHDLKNLEYRLGDIEEPPIDAGSIDLAVLSQALHHANQPAKAISATYKILKRGGRVVVLDLLAHNFEQARELYADLWLGFSEVQLHEMLNQAGFREVEVSVVAREQESPHFQTLFATGVKA